MARSSPSVLRVVAVLNFFADHPGQSFTLTDLVRALKLSRATCHGVLTGLVEAGYLYRTTDKSYVLGPALLNVSEVAASHFSPLQVAQPEMRKLADEFDAVCSAAFRERYEVVVRERAAAVSHLGYTSPRGTRLPLLPQFAAPFFAGSPPAEVRDWIDKIDPPCSRQQVDALFQGIEFIREHGFQFSVRQRGAKASDIPHQWLEDRAHVNTPIIAEFELAPKKVYDLSFIAAPVYDARRKVAFVITLQGLTEPRKGGDVQRIGERVVEACRRITSFVAHSAAAKI
jgi:DNA-binding IclR family transcriptional regulator